jgi:hypothetical protein
MHLTRIRFSLRSLTIIVAIVCVAFWAIPTVINWYYWHQIRATVIEAMADLAIRHIEPSVFLGVAKNKEYYLANHEIKWEPSRNAMVDLTDVRRADAVFVTWPRKVGQWASSPKDVVDLLKASD